jgi:hypothetical protein
MVALLGLASLALLAVWQVPQWLDWTRYRTTIEVLATARLGQPVTIQGPITLAVLPQSVLTAAQVHVGESGASDLSIHVDALRLRVALWPLIAGRVDARELVLRRPDLHVPWPSQVGALPMRPPSWLAAFAARIEDGRLTAGQLAFTGINATLATLETGALSASGTVRFTGYTWRFTARLTAAGADGAAGLNATLDGQGKANGLGASFSGQLAADGTLAGTIAGRGPSLAVLLPAPPVPFRADGRLTVRDGLVSFNDLDLDIGGSPASGTMALRMRPQQRLEMALSASRLDLDAWLPVLRDGTRTAGMDLPIGLTFSAESAPFGGGILQHVKASLDLLDKDLVVREASAVLPGQGRLQLSGRMARDDPMQARFEGEARLDAPLLRSTLRWLEEAMPGMLPPGLAADLPNGVLQGANMSAHVVTGGGEVWLSQLAGSVDDAPMSGSIGVKRGDPPGLTVDLTLDRLSLGAWLPADPPGLADLSRLASRFAAELRINIRHAALNGSTIDGLMLDAATEAGSILLRRLEGNALGAHIIASGMLGATGVVSDGILSITTPDATRIAELLPDTWRATPALWQGPAKLDVQAAGPQEALALGLQLAVADARLEAKPTVDLRSGEWSGTLTLRHPGARRLVTTLGLPDQLRVAALPDWLDEGSLSLIARATVTQDRLAVDGFDLTAAALHASGHLTVDQTGAEPRLTGLLHIDALPLPLLNGSSDVPLPFRVLHGWQGELRLTAGSLLVDSRPVLRDASAALTVMNDTLRLEQFSANVGSGALSGSFAIDAAAEPPALSLQASLSNAAIAGPLADASIDLLSGRADGTLQLSASGYSPSAILATLGGRGALTVTEGAVSGFDLFRAKLAVEKPDPKSAEAAASSALNSGATSFDRLDLSVSLEHGDLSLDAGLLSAIAGEAHFTGGMNLATQVLDLRVALQPALPSPPEIVIHLTGPLDRPSRTLELANLARWMAELAH